MRSVVRSVLVLSVACGLAVSSAPAATPFDCTGISSVVTDDPDLVGQLTSYRVASGFVRPVFVTSPQGDNERLFVVEQRGRIRIIKNGAVVATPFLNIESIVRDSGNEEGLLSMAFHPDYASNGLFWVYYTNNSGNQVIARYAVSGGNPDVADVGSGQIVLTISHPGFSNHNGGQLQFGADGALYAGTGDGGGACDPGGGVGNALNKLNLLGKILRLNVSTGPVATYTTTGNPYDGSASGADEVWSWGMRNPWRFSIDAETGNIYIGDVGQNAWEEIDCSTAGPIGSGDENYGWVAYEGDHCPNPSCGSSGSCSQPNYVAPIAEFSNGCSVIGGYVYRGCRMEPFQGSYFYTDYCTSSVMRTIRTDETCAAGPQIPRATDLTPEPGNGSINSVVSFGQDNQGEHYIVDQGGEIFKIIPILAIHEISGVGATPLIFGADWTFEDLAANSYWEPDVYRVFRSQAAVGPFRCKKLISDNDCSNGVCTWSGGDTEDPRPGEAFFYVVTGTLAGEETSPGTWTDGTERTLDQGGICLF